MSEPIIASLLALVGTMIGTFGGILTTNKLVNYRIQELEKKVEKHNNVIERVYKLEQADAVEEEEIKVINHRIADLERYHK
jgi:hypothetical protein